MLANKINEQKQMIDIYQKRIVNLNCFKQTFEDLLFELQQLRQTASVLQQIYEIQQDLSGSMKCFIHGCLTTRSDMDIYCSAHSISKCSGCYPGARGSACNILHEQCSTVGCYMVRINGIDKCSLCYES